MEWMLAILMWLFGGSADGRAVRPGEMRTVRTQPGIESRVRSVDLDNRRKIDPVFWNREITIKHIIVVEDTEFRPDGKKDRD